MAKIVINPTIAPPLTPKKKRAPILRPYYRPFFYVALPASLLTMFFAGFFYNYLPPVIPLFNTMTEVDARLADRQMIFLLPAVAGIFNLIAAMTIYFGRHYELIVLQIFSYFTIFIQVLMLAVTLHTILIII